MRKYTYDDKVVMKRTSHLVTSKIKNKLWVLKENLYWFREDRGYQYVVPEGFYTDGASSPKAVYCACAPMTGPHTEAAVLHDYLYSTDSPYELNRKGADQIFYAAMIADGTAKWKATWIYRSVRLFGRASWKRSSSIEKYNRSF